MAEYLIQCMGSGSGHPCEYDGMYLSRYEPEGMDGMGVCEWSPDHTQAVVFASVEDAFAAWRRVPVTRPVREDGMANRPLTAFSIAVVNRDTLVV